MRPASDPPLQPGTNRLHGSCVARGGAAVLVLGAPGSGKSDLVLRLLGRGFELVADDQVAVAPDGVASCPGELAGLLEARGIGIVRMRHRPSARLALVVELGIPAERLPQPRRHATFDVPVIRLDPAAVSAADQVGLALDCALGRVDPVSGAFDRP